jgi:hypothetical protein
MDGACVVIGYLRLTQFYRESACEHKIREPEMRQALIQEAEARCFPYSVEMPTDQAYRFTPLPGDGRRRGLHDFALVPEDERQRRPLVRVEFKEGPLSARRDEAGRPTDVPALSKDLRKLLLEESTDGRAVLHVLQAANGKTLSALLQKYEVALRTAQATLAREYPEEAVNRATWFSVLFLIVRHRGRIGGNRPALWRAAIDTARPPGKRCLTAEEITSF